MKPPPQDRACPCTSFYFGLVACLPEGWNVSFDTPSNRWREAEIL